MSITIHDLITQYKTYIIQDKTINYNFFNFDIIKNNISVFKQFLDEHIQYNNNTYLYFKCVYHYCKMEYDIMLELAESVKENNIYSLLGYHYQNTEINYELMKKYYLMAIELNDLKAMVHLGYYYQNIEINYDLMKKYYLMAIELNSRVAAYNLGYHYRYKEINYNLMKEYYLIAIKLDSASAMHSLSVYYQNTEINYDLMKKYYLMAINLEFEKSYLNLYDFYNNKNDILSFYKLLKKECNDSLYIKNKLIILEKNKYVAIYKNKYNNAIKHNIRDKCAICLKDNLYQLNITCGHMVCEECYKEDLLCHFDYCNEIQDN